MIDGFYAIYYTGQEGTGFGMLVLRDGTIIGADITGGRYDGKFGHVPDKGVYEGAVTLQVPAGSPLVTGAPAQAEPYNVDIPVSFKEDDIEKGLPVRVQLPTGPVNVVLKKLRDF